LNLIPRTIKANIEQKRHPIKLSTKMLDHARAMTRS